MANKGEYIGTIQARDEGEGIRDFGYAIPSNLTVAIARNVIAANSTGARRANLGFTAEILSSRSVYARETGKTRTVQSIGVANVARSGALAGILQKGDIILSVTLNDAKKEITREYQLTFLSFNLRAGDTALFEIARNGETLTLSVDFEYNDFEALF